MGKYNGAVITTAGEGVIAQALQGTKLTWTKMRTSSVAVSTSSIKGLTALTGVEQTTNITNASVYSDHIVQVSARFSNTGIATAYLIRTVGIYGQLAGGSETLIAVMTAVTPDEMPVQDADAPSAFIFTNHLVVQDAASITMDVNDTGTATVADLELKVDKAGGDVSNTVAATATASSAAYPIPAAGDSIKVILGKIRKFFTDIKAAVVGLSISGKTITYTKANGTTGTLTTQDTTYSNFTKATASAAGTNGLVPAPAAGKQGQFLRGDATWATPTNTTYTAGTGLSLSGTTFNHASTVTAGTAGTSSATSGRNTLAVPYVTYNATGHVTAAGTHTHTISNFAAASSSANGGVGLVPAPTSANYANRALMYLRSDGGWQYIPLQNNSSTTAEHYALDARMGKTLNDRITSEHVAREVLSIDLNAATWTETAQGKYIATVKQYATGDKVLGVTLGAFGNLRATDVVQPYMTGDGGRTINVMSNTKTFANASASVQIYVMYRPA